MYRQDAPPPQDPPRPPADWGNPERNPRPDDTGFWDTAARFFEDMNDWLVSLPERAWNLARDGFYGFATYVVELATPWIEAVIDALPLDLVHSAVEGAAVAAPLFWFFDGWFPLTEAAVLWGAWWTYLVGLTVVKWLLKFVPAIG